MKYPFLLQLFFFIPLLAMEPEQNHRQPVMRYRYTFKDEPDAIHRTHDTAMGSLFRYYNHNGRHYINVLDPANSTLIEDASRQMSLRSIMRALKEDRSLLDNKIVQKILFRKNIESEEFIQLFNTLLQKAENETLLQVLKRKPSLAQNPLFLKRCLGEQSDLVLRTVCLKHTSDDDLRQILKKNPTLMDYPEMQSHLFLMPDNNYFLPILASSPYLDMYALIAAVIKKPRLIENLFIKTILARAFPREEWKLFLTQ